MKRGYVIEFRDEDSKEELYESMMKAKKAVCDAVKKLEEAYEDSDYSERGGSYRSGGSYRGGSYRGGNYREDWDDDMEMRRGSRYRY